MDPRNQTPKVLPFGGGGKWDSVYFRKGWGPLNLNQVPGEGVGKVFDHIGHRAVGVEGVVGDHRYDAVADQRSACKKI